MNFLKANSSKHSFRAAVVVVALAALALLSACSKEKKTQAAAPQTVPVTVAKAETRNVPVTVTAIGTVMPIQTVQVKSMLTAQLIKVHFKEGQDVAKGQLLFELDPRTFQADLSKALGTLARDKAAAQNAHVELKRTEALLKEGVIAKQQYDTQESSAAQLDAVMQADQAAVESAKVNVQYTKIYAPVAGRTGDLLVHEGNLVKANDVPMVVINQIAPIYAEFSLPERYLADVKKYMAAGTLKALATIPDTNEALAQGKISFIDNSVDRATGTIAMKAEFVNTDRKLWPGQYVNMNLQLTTEPNATVVPTQAIQNGQQGTYVFVVKPDTTAELRVVDLGPADNGMTVIRKGVAAGETVVTDGQVRIVPGQSKLTIKQAEAPKKAAAEGDVQDPRS